MSACMFQVYVSVYESLEIAFPDISGNSTFIYLFVLHIIHFFTLGIKIDFILIALKQDLVQKIYHRNNSNNNTECNIKIILP